MRIVSLNFQDFAGVSHNLCQAINMHTEHQAISIREQDNYIQYPKMLQRGDAPDAEILKIINDADVIHINDVSVNGLYDEIWPFWLEVDLKDKIVIKHHHGVLYERNKETWDEDDKNMHAVLVSTPDLLAPCERGIWFPSPIPVSIFRKEYPARLLEQDHLRISFSDTVLSEEKGKSLIADVVKELDGSLSSKVELVNIAQKPNWVSLILIAKCDINFNQIHPRFATMSALEASTFEKPVLGNPHEEALKILDKFGVEQPYVHIVDKESLKELLQRLVEDDEYRIEAGQRAYQYVKRVHELEVSAKRFMDVVEVCRQRGTDQDLKDAVTY